MPSFERLLFYVNIPFYYCHVVGLIPQEQSKYTYDSELHKLLFSSDTPSVQLSASHRFRDDFIQSKLTFELIDL